LSSVFIKKPAQRYAFCAYFLKNTTSLFLKNSAYKVVLTAQQVSSVDMSALPAGMYLVQARAGQEQVTERVFKP
jgi:hypothetical protein